MGVTGSGKSSFIAKCSSKAVKIGHTLEGCTAVVDIYSYEMSPDRTVYLIDTPGFDDTTKSDTEVLSEIAAWMGDAYQNNVLLTGIIYLHRITDVRMQGSAKKNLLMFRQLCGKDALKRVILATTRWDEVSSEDGVRREEELKDKPEFWGWMMQKGSSYCRYDNTQSSAQSIVNQLARHRSTIATDLQRQLVDEHLALDQTSAGRELQVELTRERARLAKDQEEIEAQIQSAIEQRDREAEDLLMEERDRYIRMIEKVESNTNDLRASIDSLLAKREERIAQLEQEMKKQKDEYEMKLKEVESSQYRLEEKLEQVMMGRSSETGQWSPKADAQLEVERKPAEAAPAEHTYKFNIAICCGGCSQALERVVRKLEGVKAHEVSLGDQTITVVAEPELSYEAVLAILSKTQRRIYSGFANGEEKSVVAPVEAPTGVHANESETHVAVEWQRRPSTPLAQRMFWGADWAGE